MSLADLDMRDRGLLKEAPVEDRITHRPDGSHDRYLHIGDRRDDDIYALCGQVFKPRSGPHWRKPPGRTLCPECELLATERGWFY